ncbi:MAG: hypothetical protein GF308_01705 [Candidatus Heimdallarchaeota archaeon]|nr:hypothetical protein [Candidatus Heimdallarchaeota archaeon]
MTEKKKTIKKPLATIGERIIAFIIDFFVTQLLYVIALAIVGIIWLIIFLIDLGAQLDDEVYVMVLSIAGALLGFCAFCVAIYYVIFWPIRHEGQTIGKRMQKIRIMVVEDLEKGKIRRMEKGDLGVILMRLIFSVVDGLFFGLVGLYLMNNDPNCQRFADQQAKTVVIKDEKKS